MATRKAKKKETQGAMDFTTFMSQAVKDDAIIDLNNRKDLFYSTGDLMIDKALGGGMPAGQIWSVYGQQGSGKSLFSMGLCRDVIEQGGRVAYFDTESKISKKAINRMGLADAKAEDGTPLFNHLNVADNNLEEMIAQIRSFAESGFFKLIVIDSIDQLTTDETIEKDTHDVMRVGGGGKAQRWAEYLPSIVSALERSTPADDGLKCSLLLVRQVRDAMQSYAPGAVRTAGGKALDHSVTTTLMISPNKENNAEEDGLLVYQGAKVRVQKTNMGAVPKNPIPIRLYVGPNEDIMWGIDPIISLIEEAIALRVMPPASATSHTYIACDELCEKLGVEPGTLKFNGKNNFTAAVTNDKEFFDALKEIVVEKMNEEGIIELEEEVEVEYEELDD